MRQRASHTPFLCPKCGKPLARIVDTRGRQGTVWRKRTCDAKCVVIQTKEVLLPVA